MASYRSFTSVLSSGVFKIFANLFSKGSSILIVFTSVHVGAGRFGTAGGEVVGADCLCRLRAGAGVQASAISMYSRREGDGGVLDRTRCGLGGESMRSCVWSSQGGGSGRRKGFAVGAILMVGLVAVCFGGVIPGVVGLGGVGEALVSVGVSSAL